MTTGDEEDGGIEVTLVPEPGKQLTVTDKSRMDLLTAMLRTAGMDVVETRHKDGRYTMRLEYEAGEVDP